ncbi:MAG: S9 family peptidase [Bacteroidetes bacterium]|jgi:prolyl oligopeptidase|nr:S9 family peptidase [Bacteroidota bacterium]
MKNYILAVSLVFISWGSTCAQVLNYPKTKKVDQTDDYHGTKVADPYRWLEDDHALETKGWVVQENAFTEKYMSTIPFRDTLKARMTQLWKIISYSVPFKCGKSYFYYRHDGVQNQPVLFYLKSLEFVPYAYFDPNKISEKGTTAITQTIPSPDGNFLAFQVSEAGSDWNVIRVKDVKTLKSLPEIISGVKFSSIAWYQNGFYYSRYENKGTLNAINEFHKVYYHSLNTNQEQDILVWEDKEHPKRNFSAAVSEDQRFLIISGSESTSGNSVYVQDLLNPQSKPTAIVKGFDHDFDFLGNHGDQLLFLTNYKASRNKIISIDSKNLSEANWKDLIAEQKDILKSASLGYKNIITHYMKDASSRLYVFDMKGLKPYEIPLTGFGTIESISASQSDSNMFFNYTTFTAPSTIYRYNLKTARLGVQFKSILPYKEEEFETKQVFYTSKDGTKIPMFLVHKKGVVPNGDLPTLLYGYGGFNISKTPEFKPERLVFLEQGGLLALPNLRGGGEYGSDWHEAGTKGKKQNVFDDFIAAAEYLIKEKYTNSNRLAISGRSNGGLLVGAVMTQRPELFKVALPAVGVMDMLRFQKFTIGWAWTTDFGSSENAEEFKALYKYSPLHNIRAGVNYPATMITTADHDDRVVPGHSFKFAAQLQEYHKGENPVLIRVDVDAGHGSGKPTGKLINEQSDIFAFLFYNLGMKL